VTEFARKKREGSKNREFFEAVERGMQDAADAARKIARMHGTPIYVWEKGKIVAKKP
jgi:hypothetical protein